MKKKQTTHSYRAMKNVFKCWKYQAIVSYSSLQDDRSDTSSGKAYRIWTGQEPTGKKYFSS